MPESSSKDGRSPTRDYTIALARAFGGAVIFSLPIFMTMEMWELGVSANRLRLSLLLLLQIPLLIGLSHLCGFERTPSWFDDVVDAFVALAVGYVAAFVVLVMFGEITSTLRWDAAVGKIALQGVPGSIGALLAQSELGQHGGERIKNSGKSHKWQFLIMLVGSLFLGLSIAPTEEVIMLSQQMSAFQGIVMILVSLLIMHAFVYAVEFRGSAPVPENATLAGLFLRYTIPGYAVATLVSFYLLWTFGRIDGTSISSVIMACVVLAFPASIGAAAARLIL